VKNINEKAQKKAKEKQKMQREKEEERLKEEDKKKTADKDRDKSCEKRQNTNADEEMRKKLENDGEDVPSGRAINVNIIFSSLQGCNDEKDTVWNYTTANNNLLSKSLHFLKAHSPTDLSKSFR